MSDRSSGHDDNPINYEDSPPLSPTSLSSPAQSVSSNRSNIDENPLSDSSECQVLSDNSSPTCSTITSPAGSTLRAGQKHPAPTDSENTALPTPKVTEDRCKKRRLDVNTNSAATSSQDPGLIHYEEAGNPEDGSILLLDLSESSEEISSEDGDSDSEHQSNQSNLSDSHAGNNSDLGSEASGDSDHNFDDADQTLYPGCEKTKDEAIYELIRLYLCNKLTKQALGDILKFYVSSLPADHVMPTTVYHLCNYVRNLALPVNETEHFYCRPGLHSVASKSDPCPTCGSVDMGVFYEIPLENTIRFLFEQRGLANIIDKYSQERSQKNNNDICDVVDGSEYTRIWASCSNKYKLTLILNTDGVSPHTSSKARFWPLMFTIMEVPPHLRSSFTIVWGIWFDKKFKPDMNLYLKPFVSALQKIDADGGVSWTHPDTSVNHVSPVQAPLTVADAPARAGVLNMQEHQAMYACNVCEEKTSKLLRPPSAPNEKKKRRQRRFVFKERSAKLRTHRRILMCAKIAERDSREHKRGIKGMTVLKDIPNIDLSTCVISEYMHSVLCGVVKQISSLWFFEPGPWYIGDHINVIDEFLKKEIHPPDFVTRLPRSFDNFSTLKANEFRSYLLYFSLVIVAPYLKEEFHQHWMLLVQGIFILLSESISQNDLKRADTLLRLFVRDVGKLYGDKNYVYNVHQLSHLALFVHRWGPLWSNSAFSFEDANGILCNMIHGTKHEGRNLLNQLSTTSGNQMLRNKIITDTHANSKRLQVKGKPLSRTLTELELLALTKLNIITDGYKCYSRVSKGKELFSTEEYDKKFKRWNSYVEVQHDGRKVYGRIIVFCQCTNYLACFVQVLKVVHSKFFCHTASLTRIGHIIPVEATEDFIVCEVGDIVQKLIRVGDYLCCRPNSIERNL